MDPLRDAKMLELELILADLATVERRLERLEANIKKANKAEDVAERALFLQLKEALEAERPLRELGLCRRGAGAACAATRSCPRSRCCSSPTSARSQIREAAALLDALRASQEFARKPGRRACARSSAPIEAEMAELSPEDAQAFREDLGLAEPGLDRVIRSTYALLGPHLLPDRGRGRVPRLDDPRAARAPSWPPARSTPTSSAASSAPQVVAFDDLVAAGSLAACRERGTLRLEGKDYVVRDGDVIDFRFNV